MVSTASTARRPEIDPLCVGQCADHEVWCVGVDPAAALQLDISYLNKFKLLNAGTYRMTSLTLNGCSISGPNEKEFKYCQEV